MSNPERDDLVLLLAEMKTQLRKSTRSVPWEDVYNRTKKKILRIFDKDIHSSLSKFKRRHAKIVDVVDRVLG